MRPKKNSSANSSRSPQKQNLSQSIDHAAIATSYAQDVVAGRIIACKWVRLACQRQLDDLRKGPEFPFLFDAVKAGRACRFIEALPHVKGEWARAKERIRLEPWQCFIACVVFGWIHRESKARRFRTAYTLIPRKNGKSIFAAAVGLLLLAADAEMGAEVYAGATCERQAWEVFRPARQMVERTPELQSAFGIKPVSRGLTIVENGSRFEPVVAQPGDGASPSCGIVDEYHEHKTDILVDTFRTGMGARRQPLLWLISTSGSNLEGPCLAMQRDVERVLEGSITRDDLFGIVYGIDNSQYWAPVQSFQSWLRLDAICTCGIVRTTRIEQLAQKVCAKHATTGSDAQTPKNDAKNIDRGLFEREECAERVTRNGCSTEIRSGKREQSNDKRNGQNATPSASRPPEIDGDQSRKTDDQFSISDGSLNTASRESSSTRSISDRTENARSAANNQSSYASITATIREKFADCSVSPAIGQSLTWEILRAVYDAHSPTCEARKSSKVETDGTVWVLMPPDDWTSETALIKANPNYGVSVSIEFLRAEQQAAIQSARKQSVFRTKHLNEWVGASSAFINAAKWRELGDPTLRREQFRERDDLAYAAVDLSSKLDLTARVLVFRRNVEGIPHYYVFGQYYVPSERIKEPELEHYRTWVTEGALTATPGHVIDYPSLTDDTIAEVKECRVKEIGFDPWNSEHFAQSIAKATQAIAVEIPQQVRHLSEPMKQLEGLVAAGRIHHDANPVLAWNVGNLVAHIDAKGNVFPRKESQAAKIDGAVALIMALSRAINPSTTQSVYTTRGVLTL